MESSHLFPKHEMRQYFNALANFCGEMIAEGNVKFSMERHELYKAGLKGKYWTDGIAFHPIQFTIIVICDDNAVCARW